MAIQDLINAAIKDEISNDPQKVGYAGKTDAEIASLMSNPIIRTSVVTFEEVAPISRVLQNINAPNVVAEQDILNSKK